MFLSIGDLLPGDMCRTYAVAAWSTEDLMYFHKFGKDYRANYLKTSPYNHPNDVPKTSMYAGGGTSSGFLTIIAKKHIKYEDLDGYEYDCLFTSGVLQRKTVVLGYFVEVIT